VLTGMIELSVYAVQTSRGSFGRGLFGQALLHTRVGRIWLLRLCFGLLNGRCGNMGGAAATAIRPLVAGGRNRGALLATPALLSHAAAEGPKVASCPS